jgi:hypothetical protein
MAEPSSSHVSVSIAEPEPMVSTSQYSTVEPSLELRTPKEEEIQLSEFAFRFENDPYKDIINALNHPRHEKPTTSLCPYVALDEVSNQESTSDWSKELERTSKAIWVSSTSTTIPCSMRGNVVEAVHYPTVGACVMSEYLMDTLVGNKPPTPTHGYFKNPRWGYYFLCRGIARDVPIIINKLEMCLDFYIYDIMDFDLLLGFPLEKVHPTPLGSLDEKLREAASATSPLFQKVLWRSLFPSKTHSRS